jgi:hypothetical protein
MLEPNQEILFTRQRHEADRIGLHFDYRLVAGDKAYSWATKKEMPEPGRSVILFEQPVHDREYALSPKVVIPAGSYGAGVTTLDWVRKAKIGDHSTADQMTIHTKDGEKFLLKRLVGSEWGDKAWLFRRIPGENKYLQKVADTVSASEVSGDDWADLKSDPALKRKILTTGGYSGRATAVPADGVKNMNTNDLLNGSVYETLR